MDMNKVVMAAFTGAFMKPKGSQDSKPTDPNYQPIVDAILADQDLKAQVYAWTGVSGKAFEKEFGDYVQKDPKNILSVLDASDHVAVNSLATEQTLAITFAFIYMGVLIGQALEHEAHTSPETVQQFAHTEFASQD